MPRCLSALQVDRVSYLLQEIYGIENKNNQETKVCACGEHTLGARLPRSPASLHCTEADTRVTCLGSPSPAQGPAG